MVDTGTQAIIPFISYFITFLMVGIPTFFITRKYGRNLKRDWILILIPMGIWVPIAAIGMSDIFTIEQIVGQTLALTMIFGTIGYFVFRQKKKTV